MNNGRTEHSRAWMEARRLRAWELLQKGWKQIEVAEALGVSRGAVSRWAARARQGRLPSPAAAQASGRTAQTEGRPTGPTPGVAAAGALYLRVFQGDLDQGADCPSNPAGIRCLLSPYPGREAAQGMWLQPAKASPARLPAERGRHQGLAGPALPGTEKKAVAEGRTIPRWGSGAGSVGRRIGLLPAPFPAAHLGPGGPDPSNPPQVEPRAPERHQRRQHDRRTLPAGSGPLLQGGGHIQLSGAVAGRDRGQVAGDLGRGARPSQPGGEGMAVSGRGPAHPTGTVSRLRPGVEP